MINGSQIQSSYNPEYCLSADLPALEAGQIMVNEFGNGELTFYGAQVTSHCIAACPGN